MADVDRPSPPGLQRERTALAWDRTGVAFLVVGLLFLRATGGLPAGWIVASLAVVVFGCFLVLLGYRRYVRAGPAPRAATGLLRLVGVATILLSLASAALIVARS